MREKITLEKFRELKEKIINETKNLDKQINEYNGDNFNEISFLKENGQTLSALIKELFSYDLSKIPFEEWQDMTIYIWDDKPLDLSQTHANIDFKVFSAIYAIKGIIFKNCQIRNITSADPDNLYRANFDEQVIAANPEIFLSSLFSDEFEKKYVESKLELDDLVSLNEEQIKELSSKKIRLSYKNSKNIYINFIINHFGLPKTINIYKANPEYLPEIYCALNNSAFDEKLENSLKSALAIESIPEMMDKIDEIIAEVLRSSRFIINPTLSERFKQKHPELFISENELPKEIYDKFTNNFLTLNDYIKYYKVFSKGNFLNHLLSVSLKEIINLIGQSTFLEIISELSTLFPDGILPFNVETYNFQILLNNNFEQARNSGETFNPKDLFYLTIVKYYYNEDNLTFAKTDDPSIYGDTIYPDWIKKLGIYLKTIKEFDETYLSQITPITTISNSYEQELISNLGIQNLIRFKNEYGPLDRNLNILANFHRYISENPPTTYEEFLNCLADLFKRAINNGLYQNLELIDKIPEKFKNRYPEIFLSKDAPNDLKWFYYSKSAISSFQTLKDNPEWMEYLKDKDLSSFFSSEQPQIFISNSTQKGLFEYLYSIGAHDKVSEYILSYGNLLKDIQISISSLDNYSFDKLEDIFMEAVYKKIFNLLDNNHHRTSRVYDDSLPEKFKNKYPELFLSIDAPSELKELFYAGNLTLNDAYNHPEWMPYLERKTVLVFSDLPKTVYTYNSSYNISGLTLPYTTTYDELYTKKYGLKALLEFFIPYRSVIHILNQKVIDVKDKSREGLEANIEEVIYYTIANGKIAFSEDLPKSFKEKHPELFIDTNAPQDLKDKYYGNKLTFDDLQTHPEYISYLKNVKFLFALRNVRIPNNSLGELPDNIAYQLASLFGEYIIASQNIIALFKGISTLDQTNITIIKNELISEILNGEIIYNENVPSFIKQEIPQMFLDENAPQELKWYYYNNANYKISFTILKGHPDWKPFLENKSILPFFYNSLQFHQKEIIEFINHIGGEKQFLKLGLQKPKDVDYMISHNKLALLEKWYLKTGKKFIPDYVVMETIPFEEADKFLANGKSWSLLMRSGNYRQTPEGVDALIKLAYCFGIFEGDPQAEKRLISLICNLPRTLSEVDSRMIFSMEETILNSFTNQEKTRNNMLIGLEEYKHLREVMQKEGFDIKDNEPVLPLIYKETDEGKKRLIINEQQYPETSKWLRNYMEANNIRGMVTPQIAHTLFGGFILKYDRDFREFLLKNINEILENPNYITYVSAIQKQFDQIKRDNSNRTLTLKLAIDYVQTNKYLSVETGNEELSRISAIAGYTQEEFDTLQKIFNYGKLRTFSSIPRISSSKDEYTYEITRLIDAFPIAAGTLSDCCQELGNCAELDMEHSMTSKHGRLFVIRDEKGQIVAQSWIWRNQNVLCFDNVEVPARAFTRAEQDKHLTPPEFAQIIYNIYVKAAEELIATDEQTYKKLLEEGKITEEQYNSLKLSKVTVGLGYNDIANAIRENAHLDSESPKLPPKYEAPVPLQRPLYINDSRTQYVLSEKEGHIEPTDSETLPVHYDTYQEYKEDNINYTAIQTLKRLESSTSNRESYQLNCRIGAEETAFSELAYNYGVDKNNLRLIITPNFAIIYEETPSSIYILDLLANNKVTLNNFEKDVTKEVYLQIKLALLQLQSKGKQIDLSKIQTDVASLYSDIDTLSPNFDEERGLSHGTR